jgi:polysaccharide export outer membrane protein
MNLLSPGYRQQRSRNRRIAPARGWLKPLFLLAVFAILWTGAFGYPQAARAQNDAPPQGSQPTAVPPAAPEREPKAPLPKAEASKVDASVPETKKIETPALEIPKVDLPTSVPAPAAGGAKAGTAPVASKSYIIGPNDVLLVKVWNQPQISGMVDVHLDGMISIPLAGEIKADGLTAVQLKDVVTQGLEETALTAPVVDVSVVKINSKHYRVYGGVQRPGEFPLAERITIMDALSLTGFKDFAKQDKIEIRRGKETFHFNYKDYIKGKNMDKNVNLVLQDGDEIIVHE